MTVGQNQFTAALLDPNGAVPEGLTNPDGARATKRFDVYRNNVIVSLSEALAASFPVVQKLVGEAFFTSLAGVFVRLHPPESPVIARYGGAFPAFLEGFEHTQKLPYLPDVARLELAMRESYHAADREPADVAVLQSLSAEALMAMRLTLAPSVRLVRSAWPICAIYRANTEADAPKVEMHADEVLITRPDFDPVPTLLPPGGGAFVAALLQEVPLADALGLAGEGFDLTETLSALIGGKAITAID